MRELKIHVTYGCTAECDHCYLWCSRKPGPAIDYGLAIETVRELHALRGLDNVALLGGEPGLFPDLTHRLAASIRRLGVPVRVETNAFWATSHRKACAFLGPLRAIGVLVSISLDAFHEPFVEPQRVYRAVRACEQLGVRYVLDTPYVDFEKRNTEPDLRTAKLLRQISERMEGLPHGGVWEEPVYFKGRSAHRLAHLVSEGRGVPSGPCNVVLFGPNGSQRTLDLVALDPEGYLSKECGIAIGNVRHTSVRHVVESFDAACHPVLATLTESGPLGLAREAQQYGYKLKQDYADKCHLCEDARLLLREKYPEYLVPDQHYATP